MARPVNPYIAGAPLRDVKGFFGRQETLQWVERELRNPHTNALVLFGQRRIGKTSVLLQLQQALPQDAFLPVYFDLQDQATRPLGKVLSKLANRIIRKAGLEKPNENVFDDQGDFFRDTFLPKLELQLGSQRRLVLLLDEFDVLDQVAEGELGHSVAAKAFFPFLRSLMTENPWPAFVFISGRRAEDLSLDFTASFKASLKRELWTLDRQSAEELIGQAVTNGTLRFTSQGMARILSLTNRHPYLTQLLCQRLWEQVYRNEPPTPPLIDSPQVEHIIPDTLKSGEQALIWLWNGLSPAEKIYAAVFAEIAAEEATLSKDKVIQVLVAHAARLRTREVELASGDLVKRRVLEKVGEQEYRFSIELLRRWVRENKPLRDVKDEIDQINPVAEQLFKIGREEFRRRQWESAIRYFKDALERYSHHFRARLYLGEALLEIEQIDDAVKELERAYELDKDEAKFALIRGLLSQAKASQKAGDEDRVLVLCKRILTISPHEPLALELQTTIWTRRGDEALAKNNLEEALKAYQAAGDSAKIKQVQILQQRQSLAALETQAQADVEMERWGEATATYQQLIIQAPDKESRNAWEKEWKRCQEEQELASFFAQGLHAMQQKKWDEAQQAFLQVVNRRVMYQKNGHTATELLDEVTKALTKLKALTEIKPLILQEQQHLAVLETQAQADVKTERWGEAATKYQQLVIQAPDEESRNAWEKEWKRCEEEQELASLFAQGLSAMQEAKWEKAQQAFLQVVNRRATYQKHGRFANNLLHEINFRYIEYDKFHNKFKRNLSNFIDKSISTQNAKPTIYILIFTVFFILSFILLYYIIFI